MSLSPEQQQVALETFRRAVQGKFCIAREGNCFCPRAVHEPESKFCLSHAIEFLEQCIRREARAGQLDALIESVDEYGELRAKQIAAELLDMERAA